jgi:hypothetical protein
MRCVAAHAAPPDVDENMSRSSSPVTLSRVAEGAWPRSKTFGRRCFRIRFVIFLAGTLHRLGRQGAGNQDFARTLGYWRFYKPMILNNIRKAIPRAQSPGVVFWGRRSSAAEGCLVFSYRREEHTNNATYRGLRTLGNWS